MRPTLNILSDELIAQILDEAKRIMAETGMEIRGEALKQRLLDHGLQTDASGKRILFPADVVERAIENSSKPGDAVLDLFLGSGTTLMAAERTGRVGVGVELDPHYCDIVIARWEAFTGKKAERVA